MGGDDGSAIGRGVGISVWNRDGAGAGIASGGFSVAATCQKVYLNVALYVLACNRYVWVQVQQRVCKNA